MQSFSYDAPSNTATLTFDGVLPDARYRATVAAAGFADDLGNPMQANHVFDFFHLTADANHDGGVNLADFNVLAANFGQSPRDASQGDFNYDTIVNLADFNLLAARFGTTIAGEAGRPGDVPPPPGERVAAAARSVEGCWEARTPMTTPWKG